jgi:hypothetical protein
MSTINCTIHVRKPRKTIKLLNDAMQPLPCGYANISRELQIFVSKNSTYDQVVFLYDKSSFAQIFVLLFYYYVQKLIQVVSLYGRSSLHRFLSYYSITMSKS